MVPPPYIPFISFTVDRVGDLLIEEILLQWKVYHKIKLLQEELQAIQSFLAVTDCKQYKKDERVKNWVRDVRAVAYEAEDILQSVFLKLTRYSSGNYKKPKDKHKIASKIDQLNQRIQDIAVRRTTYGIANIGDDKGQNSNSVDQCLQVRRQLEPQLDENTSFVGLKIDIEKISRQLKDENSCRTVIPFLGMGGIGKTILANIVYKKAYVAGNSANRPENVSSDSNDGSNSDRLGPSHNHFDVCAWLSVTQYYMIEELLRKLMRKLGPGIGVSEDALEKKRYAELVTEVHRFLKDKRYLIVMDDVWKTEVWDLISVALPANRGSKVIITTRSREVARHSSPDCDPHELQPLNTEDSWELFCRTIFCRSSDATRSCPAELRDLGMELSKKCRGFPLALVVLGGLVSAQPRNPAAWLKLVRRMSWESTEAGRQCLEILALSYNELPYHMRSCFLYLAAFPQGSKIRASKLIQLWTNDGIIAEERDVLMEDTAEHYLEEMIRRCLVQVVKRRSDGSVKTLRVHDFMSKLAIVEARENRFLHIENLQRSASSPDTESKAGQEAHRLVLHEQSTLPRFQLQVGKLRALLLFHNRLHGAHPSPTPSGTIKNFSTCLKYVRVLELENMQGADSLKDVNFGYLAHLRYLGLRNTNLSKPPKGIGKLHSLQTLNIRGTQIQILPDEFWKLRGLRHLYLNSILPQNIGSFSNLQTLHQAQAGRRWIETDLPMLNNLRKVRIESVAVDDAPALCESLKKLDHLKSLKLQGGPFAQELITAISQHQHLHELVFNGAFSKDINLPFPRYITKLVLVLTKLEQDPMPVLEKLSTLRVLKLKLSAYVGDKMVCSAGGFPALQRLKLSEMFQVKDWTLEEGAMPGLISLSIYQCPKLMVPEGLKHVTSLQKLKLGMFKEFLNRARPNGQD